jgi:ankyrin repeat protein
LPVAKNGYEVVIKLLIDAQADVKFQSDRNRTPLWYAAENKHKAAVKTLRDAEADAKLKNKSGWMLLPWTARNRHKAVIGLPTNVEANKSRPGAAETRRHQCGCGSSLTSIVNSISET